MAERWATDRKDWTWHADRALTGTAWFRARHSVRQSAYVLSQHEEAQQRLDAQEAFDDPIVLAARAASGDGLIGDVTDVDAEHKEQGPKNMVSRPLITVAVDDRVTLLVGASLWWTANPKVKAELIKVSDDGLAVVLKVVGGMTQDLPTVGTVIGLSATGLSVIPSAKLPKEVPWTHHGGDTLPEPVEVPE